MARWGLAEPAGGKEQGGTALLDKAEGKHLVDECAVDAGGMLEVEVGEGGGMSEVTLLVTATEGVGPAALDFGLGDAVEQRLVREGAVDGIADDLGNGLRGESNTE